MSEEKFYICETCNARVKEGDIKDMCCPKNLVNHAMLDFFLKLDEEKGIVHEPSHYHMAHSFKSGRCTRYLCGPLHEENEQEYFVNRVCGKI